jgi:F0F1-type ATP synthase assembly protein I
MVIPGLLGYAIDVWLGTRAVFTLLGFIGGVSYGIWQLVRLGQTAAERGRSADQQDNSADPTDRGSSG